MQISSVQLNHISDFNVTDTEKQTNQTTSVYYNYQTHRVSMVAAAGVGGLNEADFKASSETGLRPLPLHPLIV